MSEQDLDPLDQKAMEYCLGVLRDDPDAHYKEVRRAARADKGLTLKRHVWTLARQQLGLKGDEEPGEETGERDARPALRPEAPTHQSLGWNARPAAPRPRWQESGPDSAPPSRDTSPASQPPRRRPAWAMPQTPTGSTPTDDTWRAPASHAPTKAPREKELPEILKQARNPVEFMVGYLQQVSRDANFAEVETAAEEFGFTVYPTTFGRAQAIVGIVEAPTRAVPAAAPAAAPAPAATYASAAPVTQSVILTRPNISTPTGAGTEADPLEGLMNYFVALDRRAAGSVQTRRLMQQMLHAVDEALHAPVELEPETTAPTP
ncbi:MAG: hypothetical protein EXS14_10275 [Planctomycetes bacterium]|nr:hypothetical protein [Planctomycetota bacterium]